MSDALHIREVVRITGLRREQLYMWQRRYGFPSPLRDAFGDRVYPPDQLARLKLIKQLLSEGWRAGAVVPLADSALQSMLGLAVDEPSPLPSEIETSVRLLAQHRIGEMQNHLSKLLLGQGLRKFLEQTLIPLNEAVHERVVRGEMQNYQELRFADLAQRLLRDVTRLVRPTRDARPVLLATPPNDPNQLGLAILELLLFTEGVNCLTLGSGVPAQEIAGAARAYKVAAGHPAVRPRDLGQDRRPGNPEPARKPAGRAAAGRQRARGQPARQADCRCPYGGRFQLGDGQDARAFHHAGLAGFAGRRIAGPAAAGVSSVA